MWIRLVFIMKFLREWRYSVFQNFEHANKNQKKFFQMSNKRTMLLQMVNLRILSVFFKRTFTYFFTDIRRLHCGTNYM